MTLRRRISLPDVTPDGGAQPVTIGGQARRLSPVSIDEIAGRAKVNASVAPDREIEMAPGDGFKGAQEIAETVDERMTRSIGRECLARRRVHLIAPDQVEFAGDSKPAAFQTKR